MITADRIPWFPAIVSSNSMVWIKWRFASETHRPKNGGSAVEDLLLTVSKTSIKLEAIDSELNDVRSSMLSVSNVLNHIRLKRLGTKQNRGDRVRNLSLRRKTTTKLKVISTGDKKNEEKRKRNWKQMANEAKH